MAIHPALIGAISGGVSGGPAGAGYFGGGSGSYLTYVTKIVFPTDEASTLGTGLSTATAYAAGFGNAGVAGYIAGGSGLGTAIDKFLFADDTRSTLSATLSLSLSQGFAGASNNAVAGYTYAGDG